MPSGKDGNCPSWEASPGEGLTLHAGLKQVPGPAPVQGEGPRLQPPPPEETKVIT